MASVVATDSDICKPPGAFECIYIIT